MRAWSVVYVRKCIFEKVAEVELQFDIRLPIDFQFDIQLPIQSSTVNWHLDIKLTFERPSTITHLNSRKDVKCFYIIVISDHLLSVTQTHTQTDRNTSNTYVRRL